MYNHILVPVSFEDDRNVSAAVAVAGKLMNKGGKLTMLHVMEQVPSYALNYVPEGFHNEAKQAIVKSLDELAVGVENAEGAVVEGHSGRTILDWAADHKPDLIVIASHQPAMKDYLLGSTAAQVVRHAKCSVHVVR